MIVDKEIEQKKEKFRKIYSDLAKKGKGVIHDKSITLAVKKDTHHSLQLDHTAADIPDIEPSRRQYLEKVLKDHADQQHRMNNHFQPISNRENSSFAKSRRFPPEMSKKAMVTIDGGEKNNNTGNAVNAELNKDLPGPG